MAGILHRVLYLQIRPNTIPDIFGDACSATRFAHSARKLLHK
jgi:hypothetical protein